MTTRSITSAVGIKNSRTRSTLRKKTLRDTTKGELVVKVLHRRVWLWEERSRTARCWRLIVLREITPPRRSNTV